jgi:alkanesulfonate monooxygenase SsuD/methylene tetrahydromethanopterin reductase-like flavin-dependent oxidoreductase (luciferase family)
MKLDRSVMQTRLEDTAAAARQAEDDGYHGIFSSETAHDPFLPLVIAAEHTRRLELMTCIAVAFARNPMTLAVTAHDLHHFSGERFILGLGSQIRPTSSAASPWSGPTRRPGCGR